MPPNWFLKIVGLALIGFGLYDGKVYWRLILRNRPARACLAEGRGRGRDRVLLWGGERSGLLQLSLALHFFLSADSVAAKAAAERIMAKRLRTMSMVIYLFGYG